MKTKLSLFLVALCSASCSSPKLKAPPPQPTAFLAAQPSLKDERKTSPFALSGGSSVSSRKKIFIAPVTTTFLRPASKFLAKNDSNPSERQREADQLALYARHQFFKAFTDSPNARYRATTDASPEALVLQLAITELNQNTIAGAVGRFAISFATLPGAEVALGKATRGLKGNIAMEGKLTDPVSDNILYQFADQEESRPSLILPITDFARYGQAREAIRAWAKQFEEITRVPPGTKIKDTNVIGIF